MSDTLRRAIKRLGDQELAVMLGPERDTYTAEAIAVAEAEAAARGGIEVAEVAKPSEPEVPPSERRGVGGWLGLLAGLLPLGGLAALLSGLEAQSEAPFLGGVEASLGLYTLFAGVLLWREQPEAIWHVWRALLLSAVVNGLALLVTAAAGSPAAAGFTVAVGVNITWIAYLHRSARVANTFPAFRSWLAQRGLAAPAD